MTIQPPAPNPQLLQPADAPPKPQTTADNSWDDDSASGIWGEASRGAADVPASLRPGGGFVNVVPPADNVWDNAQETKEPPREAPKPASGTNNLDRVPDILKPGANRAETNPFLRNKAALQSQLTGQAQNSTATPPSDTFAKPDLNETSNNPWQSAIDSTNAQARQPPQPTHPPPMPPSIHQPGFANELEKDPWADAPVELPTNPPGTGNLPDLISLGSEDSGSSWDDSSDDEDDKTKAAQKQQAAVPAEIADEQHVWDDLGSLDKGKGKALNTSTEQSAQLDEWNLIDAESSKTPPTEPLVKEPTQVIAEDEERPSLPPRRHDPQARWVPSRDPVDGQAETYQIKNIRWHDPSAAKNPRTSPILIQNLNGPCPLVALVNALTMTTSPDAPDTALVETLRSREQVSLTLLLDAVFDELMSPRRTSEEDALPDVGDLYGFLQSLHTGMNVNPRFVPTREMINAYKRTSLTHLHPTERDKLIPGTFENTMEMSLYATFSIPLIHGWLPPNDDPAYAALQRQAVSYEDVQNLLFREEELEAKLSDSTDGLTEDEQQVYEDVVTIKMFLDASATQLTPWGIEVIGKAIRPGTFAILFRNDHFSTLYCHPETMQLLTLVTDAGYKSHDEIVWESLVDVNGEHTEFLSGDFRLVSNGGGAGSSNLNSGSTSENQGGQWTTVQTKRGKSKEPEPEPELDMSMATKHEQEDRDLALALQLQEEEEQRQREDEARRRQESQLSEQYIEQQGRLPNPVNRGGPRETSRLSIASGRRESSSSSNVPVTTLSSRSGPPQPPRPGAAEAPSSPRPIAPPQQEVRPLVPPRRPGVTRQQDDGDDPPPPTYEQSANDQAYAPPVGHPSHAPGNVGGSRGRGRGMNAPAGAGQGRGTVPGRRPPGYPVAGAGNAAPSNGQGRDRDCVVM